MPSLAKGVVYVVARHHDPRYGVVYLGRYGRFGDAFGIVSWPASGSPGNPSRVVSVPLLVEGEFARNGRWPIAGRFPALIDRFQTPAMYHHPSFHPKDERLRPHGVAEYENGGLRQLSREESDAIFGDPRKYGQSWLDEDFESLIARMKAGSRRL